MAYLKSIAPKEPPPDLTTKELEAGKTLFVKQCAVCHGPTGAGDGPSAPLLNPTPTNFRKIRPTLHYAETALADGVRGTAMPKWGPKLTPAERSLLARYVRSYYGKDSVE